MTPQLYITVYTEQFASPGRVKRTQLRPTSAHRRNNPQPRTDFLFPRSLQTNYRLTNTQPHRSPTVDLGRPLFPPVRHLSFQGPAGKCPGNYLNTVDLGGIQHTPPANAAAEPALPSADRLQKLQLTKANAAALPRRMDYQMNVHLPPAWKHAGIQLQTRPQTSKPPAATHRLPCVHNCRRRSHSALDHGSSCYSCFHVVKPHQAGNYIIHPEFVSECLP